MKYKKLIFAFCLVLSTLTIPVQAQVANGNFDSSTPLWPAYSICTPPAMWYSDPNPNLDIQWTNMVHTSWWVDLTGCAFGAGHWIEQKVPTIPNTVYTLSFDLGSWWGYTNMYAATDVYINGGLVGTFVNSSFNFNPTYPILWQTFDLCFVATSNITTIRFVGQGVASPWTPPGGTPAITALDNVNLTATGTNNDFAFFASDTCVPTTLNYTYPSGGTSKWYYNGTLINTGSTSLPVNLPGNYRLEFFSTDSCGIFIVDTNLVECDTCDKISAQYFCGEDTTYFNFAPPNNCVDSNCIGKVNIDFGDGITDVSLGKTLFKHSYSSTGTYTVQYCWENVCTGVTKCRELVIEIISCPQCTIDADFTYTVGCNMVWFTNTSSSNYHVLSTFWTFGDGGTSKAWSPSHLYGAPGTYNVCLTIHTWGPNNAPCKKTICKTVVVPPCGPARMTGIGDTSNQLARTLSIFPNPSAGEISVTDIYYDGPSVTLSIYDLTGRMLIEEKVDRGVKETKLSIKHLEPGTYILKLKGLSYNKEIKLIRE